MSPKNPSLPSLSHVGIIMDGNRRWAKRQGLSASEGHLEGLKNVKEIVTFARTTELKALSLYTFSTENWKRSQTEVFFLMGLIKKYLAEERAFYMENSIRVVVSGDLSKLPADVQKELRKTIDETAHFEKLTVNLLINYGGQQEIIRAVNAILTQKGGQVKITKELLASHLDHPELPPLDLIIRAGGEFRLSNFLLWQSAYSEYIFTDTLWPDWKPSDFQKAIDLFYERSRRYGGNNTKAD